MEIIHNPSLNFSKSNYVKFGVQLHKTLGLMPDTLGWLTNKKSYVSAHYLITKKGQIHQLVQLNRRSWSSGKIYKPSKRAKKIMLKNFLTYVKPSHYLIQVEFECLENETYTEEQYKSFVWLCYNVIPFPVSHANLLTHQDTCSYKPNLEKERREIVLRLSQKQEVTVDKEAIKKQIIELVHQL